MKQFLFYFLRLFHVFNNSLSCLISACKMHLFSSTACPDLTPNKLRALTSSSVEARMAGDLRVKDQEGHTCHRVTSGETHFPNWFPFWQHCVQGTANNVFSQPSWNVKVKFLLVLYKKGITMRPFNSAPVKLEHGAAECEEEALNKICNFLPADFSFPPAVP